MLFGRCMFWTWFADGITASSPVREKKTRRRSCFAGLIDVKDVTVRRNAHRHQCPLWKLDQTWPEPKMPLQVINLLFAGNKETETNQGMAHFP
jgi:hypothetical protein